MIATSTMKADAGWPGSPMTGIFPYLPIMVGLPGEIAIPWIRTAPSSLIIAATISRSSLELPPEIRTASHSDVALQIAERSASRSSAHYTVKDWCASLFPYERGNNERVYIPHLSGQWTDIHWYQFVPGGEYPDFRHSDNRHINASGSGKYTNVLW